MPPELTATFPISLRQLSHDIEYVLNAIGEEGEGASEGEGKEISRKCATEILQEIDTMFSVHPEDSRAQLQQHQNSKKKSSTTLSLTYSNIDSSYKSQLTHLLNMFHKFTDGITITIELAPEIPRASPSPSPPPSPMKNPHDDGDDGGSDDLSVELHKKPRRNSKDSASTASTVTKTPVKKPAADKSEASHLQKEKEAPPPTKPAEKEGGEGGGEPKANRKKPKTEDESVSVSASGKTKKTGEKNIS